jgi:hypothetical protein
MGQSILRRILAEQMLDYGLCQERMRSGTKGQSPSGLRLQWIVTPRPVLVG